ncbi:unnamed protein product [Ectocarpus sp. 13 AM-2016]
MVGRVTKAHTASTRQDLSERQLLGEDRLHEDFVAQVVTPSLLHVANDIAAHPLNEIGKHESIVWKCTRKERAWGRLSNGGYSTTNARACSVLHAAVHDGPALHSLRTPDHRQAGLRDS